MTSEKLFADPFDQISIKSPPSSFTNLDNSIPLTPPYGTAASNSVFQCT